MDILGGDDEIKLAILLQDIAFAHRAGDNRNHGEPLKNGFLGRIGADLPGAIAG
jgi:hypothetical protein